METSNTNLTIRLNATRTHIKDKEKEVQTYIDFLQKFQLKEKPSHRDAQVDTINGIILLCKIRVTEIEKEVIHFIKHKRSPKVLHHYLERVEGSLDIIEHKISSIEIPRQSLVK